jgi:hypothetical protein
MNAASFERTFGAIVDPACVECRGRREGVQIYSTIRLADRARLAWDIELALHIASDGRPPITIQPAHIDEMLRVNQVDSRHLDHVDPTVPGIVCVLGYTENQVPMFCLIDGSHRAARCRRDGLVFRVYVLSLEESNRCQQTAAVELFLMMQSYQARMKEQPGVAAVYDPSCSECQEKQLSPQVYTFERLGQPTIAWSIELAIKICSDGRTPSAVLPEHLDAILSVNETNPAHLDHVDPNIPGIACLLDYGAETALLLLIDGSHRAARCRRDSIPFFVYLLSAEESWRCQEEVRILMMKLISGLTA